MLGQRINSYWAARRAGASPDELVSLSACVKNPAVKAVEAVLMQDRNPDDHVLVALSKALAARGQA